MPLNKADLRQCLAAWAEQPEASIATVATQIGLSRQRVKSAQQWALLSNLLNLKGLTDVGKLALEKDPYLEATVTDWVIHFFSSLSDNGLQNQPENPSDWGFATFVIYDFLLANPSFTQEELAQSAASSLESDVGAYIKIWLKTYTQRDGLANCQFLTHNKNSYTTGNPNLQNPHTVGYLLANIWARDFGQQSSLLVGDLINSPMGLAAVLGIQELQLREQLDRLAELEIIEQRSAKPHKMGTQPERRQQEEPSYMVVRCWDDSLELLAKAYEQDPAVPNRPLIQSLEGILDDDDGELPFLSSVQTWFSNLCPKQPQLPAKGPTFDPPLHLAG